MKTILKNGIIINEGRQFVGSLLLEGGRIAKITENASLNLQADEKATTVDCTGKYILPGCIDDQVHFREPGLTHKGSIHTESIAAVAGGITSFMDMPNTIPQTTTIEALNQKFERAAEVSVANYSFFLGATNDNIAEITALGAARACGIKVFMGSSTGNMLVDKEESLRRIFSETDKVVATHNEKEEIIRANIERFKQQYGDNLPVALHPLIRSEEACYVSSAEAAQLASQCGGRLHLLHLSTAREMTLLSSGPVEGKKITGEVCVHHLWFTDADYAHYGTRIKWNPSIKTIADRDALRHAVKSGQIDMVATDHAPHLLTEKEGGALKAASGGPLVQHSLVAMLQMVSDGVFSIEEVVMKMAHAPALLFGVKNRGFLREGYHADVVVVDPHTPLTVAKENILYHCGWSPFEGTTFSHSVWKTFINGSLVYTDGQVDTTHRGKELELNG